MHQYCAYQQNGVASYEEMRNSVAISTADRRDSIVCPKPRRVGLLSGTVTLNYHPTRPLRWQLSHQAELADSKAGSELLDIIFAKGSGGQGTVERSSTGSQQQIASSPPFFCGSPPSRVSNPLIQDARFKEEAICSSAASSLSGVPVSVGGLHIISPSGQPLSPTSSSSRKGGCVRANFGNNPAVRVEGFDCLDRDRSRNCSIAALA